ncbi:halocyanin domain-containing protein [Halomarina oriensis]|uniref:halocyanin domain-containing protein n=1 Tax=Halomarina oriensis TaxID=671145 RepID=UPI0034A4E36A
MQPPASSSTVRPARRRPTRRAFLAVAAGSLAVGTGCLNDGSGGSGGEGYGDWFDDVDNHDGAVDRTGQSETSVAVGAEDGLAFAPAAIEVDPGTTVVWEWTGRGGGHNVVERDDAFSSPLLQAEGETWSYTFEEVGVFPYFCDPHRTLGMKGGVDVVGGADGDG